MMMLQLENVGKVKFVTELSYCLGFSGILPLLGYDQLNEVYSSHT